MRGITGRSWLAWLSPTDALEQLGDAMFRLPPRFDLPVWAAALVVVALIAGVAAGPRAPRPRRRGGALMADAIVQAEHLSKWYGQVNGLNDVTVTIPPGVTGLLGPNGAGKSTFMKLMTGQLKPSQGTIRVLGDVAVGPARGVRPRRLLPRAGRVLRPDDRPRVGHGAGAAERPGDAEAAAAAERALAQVDLTDAAGKKIGAYSKGMRQRVKLAQALVHDPDVLILDEPLTGMDPLQRRKTIRLIKDWARHGKHVIVSSHILHEIEAMTSNILLINNGRIVAEGNVHQIRDLIDTHPHTVHVRAADPRALAAPAARRRRA